MNKIPGWKKEVYIWLFQGRCTVLFHKYMQTPEFHVSLWMCQDSAVVSNDWCLYIQQCILLKKPALKRTWRWKIRIQELGNVRIKDLYTVFGQVLFVSLPSVVPLSQDTSNSGVQGSLRVKKAYLIQIWRIWILLLTVQLRTLKL